MGAYENPPIIQQPNLSDIWNRNFRAAQEATAKAFAPAIEFKKEEAKRKAIRDNTVAKLRQEAGNTKPALTSYVIKKVDELAKETARYNKEKSDSERFLKFQAQSFSAVDKIKNTGSALAAFSKNLSEKNISNFQSKESAKTLGFLDAFNNQRFTDIKEDENGSLNIGFSNPFDGESLYMTEAEYTDENSYKINEVFDPTETIETGVDLLKSKLSNEKNIFKYDLKDGFGEGSTKQQLWEDPKLKDPKNRINFVSNSSFMKQLTTQELGSYIEDNIRKKQKDLSTDEDYLEVTKDLTKEQKRVVDYYAKSSFINEEITLLSGDKINPANYMEAMAKLKIAKDIVNEGPQDVTSVQTDKTSKTIEDSLKAKLSGKARQRTVDLTKETYDALVNSVYQAEQSGGDANALASLLNNVKFGDGIIMPSQGEFIYNTKTNKLNIPVVTGGNKVKQREIDLKNIFGEEMIVNAILQKRGIGKNEIKFASEALSNLINEFDPFDKRFQEEINNDFAQ